VTEGRETGPFGGPPTGRVTPLGRLRLYWTVIRRRPASRVVGVPAAASAVVLVLAFIVAPDIDPGTDHGRFSNLFGTTAQVIATLIVALAFEARALKEERDANVRRLVATVTVGYAALGGIASVVALNPELPGCMYRPLFAIAMAGGLGALLTVLATAYRIMDARL
jgi:hypothetical protein